MHIRELLSINDTKERDLQLRRSFKSYTPLLEVDGEEFTTLCILLNLNQAKDEVEDLCDVDCARGVLKDRTRFGYCLDNCHWLHTHNLKYPEPRVSLQRLLAPSPPKIKSVITSANVPREYGWAYNAKFIRYSQLFAASYIWGGKVTCLGDLLINGEPAWEEQLRSLGVSKNRLTAIKQELNEALCQQAFPAEVSPFSVQIQLPYCGNNCAVTPVVSHSLQCQIQRMVFSGKGWSTSVKHQHPTNISQLATSLNGFVKVLNYPPSAKYRQNSDFHQARTARLHSKHAVFNDSACRAKAFLNALGAIVNKEPGLTVRQSRQKRVAALRTIRHHLIRWLEPVLEWREYLRDSGNNIGRLDDSLIESKLLKAEESALSSLVRPLSAHFHNRLQHNHRGREFAYHQALLQPIHSQLNWILGRVAESENIDTTNDLTVYVHLAGLRAFDVHALANPYLVGVPSIFALFGLSHAFELGIRNKFDTGIKITGTAWFIHNYTRVDGNISSEANQLQHTRQVSYVKPPGLIDTKLCDLEMDLVLRIKVKKTSDYDLVKNKPLILSALPSRFAGGSIHPPSLYHDKEWYKVYKDPVLMFRVLSRLPRYGCWVYPSGRQSRDLSDMIDALDADRRLRPAAVGYALLESPCQRIDSIADLHCYAEPALGLVECLNPIDMRLAGLSDFLKSAFWQLYTDKHSMLMKASPSWEVKHEIM